MIHALRDVSTNVAVAVPRGRLHGFAIMQYQNDSAHLALLAVAPTMRHQGFGRQLVVWLERLAQFAGISLVRLECRTDNHNAIAFYRHLGYRDVGHVPGYCEGRFDAVRMDKTLHDAAA